MNDHDEMNHLMGIQRLEMNQILYGDIPPATRWQIFKWRWRMRFGRVIDAWMVLIGRAHVE